MNPNTQAQTEQATQAPSLAELTNAFAQVSFMWASILTHATENQDTANSRFKWLSDEAIKLADIAMQHHTNGVQLAK